MTQRDRRVDVYLDKAGARRAEMAALREIVLGCDVVETFKWRQPCYVAHRVNVCLISSRKAAATLSFFRGALMADAKGLLIARGPNSQAARYMVFESVDEVAARAHTIRVYVDEAVGLARDGRKVAFTAKETLDLPDALTAALDADPVYAEAFAALTPGRQRSWALYVSGAKKAETRAARAEKAREKVMAGKGWNER